LSEKNEISLIIPKGVAHGFQTLKENVELLYFHDNFYNPSSQDGVHPLDPMVQIKWLLPITEISQRDASFEFLSQ
jgi:dTDP-4-dehydrorhamnose 3,5-epimerase